MTSDFNVTALSVLAFLLESFNGSNGVTYFSEHLDAQEIQYDNKDRENGNPSRWWDWCVPIL
jgi:hypothetical protein